MWDPKRQWQSSEGLCGVDRIWNTGIGHGPQRIESDQRLHMEFRGGIEQKREAQEVQSGLESGLMGICRKKGGLNLLWIEWKSP